MLGGALLTALLSAHTTPPPDAQLPGRRLARRGRVLVPAAVLRRGRRAAARRPRPDHPGRRPGGHHAARLRAGRPAPRRPAGRRGRAEVLPLLGHRDRRDAARHQLRVRRHRHAAPGHRRRRASPTPPGQLHTLARTGAALTLVGFAFKLAVAPFHFWVPDTYAGAPLPVAAYLSVVGKAAGLLRADPGHRDRLPPVRRHLGPGDGRAGRAHHDRRQRRRPAAAPRRGRAAPYACSPGPRSARPATCSSRWRPSPPAAPPATRSAPPSPTP